MRHVALPTVTILEPHPDDVALSLGGLIASRAGTLDAELWLIFSESLWAPRLPPGAAIREARLAEDRRYASRFGLRHREFDFPDASVIGLSAIEECEVPVETDWRLPVVVDAVAPAIAPEGFVMAPLGIGTHVDHLLTRRCSDRAAARCVYYEELPYASRASARERYELARTAFGAEPCAWTFDISRVREDKRSALLLYESQFTPAEIDALMNGAPSPSAPVERVWAWNGDVTMDRLLASLGFARERG